MHRPIASQLQKQQKVASPNRGNVAAFVQSISESQQAAELERSFQSTTQELLGNFPEAQKVASGPVNVGHTDLFVMRQVYTIQGSLRDLAANPDRLTVSASASSPFPVGQRPVLLESRTIEKQNTSPVPFAVSVTGRNQRTSKTMSNIGGAYDIHLSPHIVQPQTLAQEIFQRTDLVDTALAGYENLTHERIQSEIINRHTNDGIVEFKANGYIAGILASRIGEAFNDNSRVLTATRDNVDVVLVSENLAELAIAATEKLCDSLAFEDPSKVHAVFSRADGKAIDSLDNLVSSAPDIGAFEQANVLDMMHTISVTIEDKYMMWAPVMD